MAAKTAADHEQIAAEYDALAKDARAKADEHKKMAADYRKAGGPMAKAQFPEHCDGLVRSTRSRPARPLERQAAAGSR